MLAPMPLAMPAPVVMRVPSLSIRSYQGGRVGAETCSRLRLTFERAVSPSCAHRRENPRLDDPKPGAWLSRTRGTLCAPILAPAGRGADTRPRIANTGLNRFGT